MQPPSRESTCETCGAPFAPGLVACRYCKNAYREGVGGIACPQCGDLNVSENSQCVSCHAPLVHGCVFCGQASPLGKTACVRCGEAFAGAEQRKQARDAQQKQQQMMKVAEDGIGAIERAIETPQVRNGLLGLFEELVDEATKMR